MMLYAIQGACKGLDNGGWYAPEVLVCFYLTLGLKPKARPKLLMCGDRELGAKDSWEGAEETSEEYWTPRWRFATLCVLHSYPGRLYGTRHMGVVLDRNEQDWEEAFRYLARRESNPLCRQWDLGAEKRTETTLESLAGLMAMVKRLTAVPNDWRSKL